MRVNPPPDGPVKDGWIPAPDGPVPANHGVPPEGRRHLPAEDVDRTEPIRIAANRIAPVAEESGGQKKHFWSSALNHPVWTTLGALVGVVGLVVSVVQIVQSLQTPPAELEIAALTADNEQSVQGAVTGGAESGTRSVGLTPVDLTLQNKGGEPALITRIDADLVYFRQLDDCSGAAPAPDSIAARYHLAIPMSGAEPAEAAVSSEVRFEVKADTADRMVFTLGPQTQPAFETTPMVMSAKIKLVHDGDQVLDVGTVSLVTTVDAAAAQMDALASDPSPQGRACARKNLEYLDEMFQIQATRSRVLDALRSVYQQAAT